MAIFCSFLLLKKLRDLCPVPAIVPTDINIHLVVMFFWDFVSFSRSLSNCTGFLIAEQLNFCAQRAKLSLAVYCI